MVASAIESPRASQQRGQRYDTDNVPDPWPVCQLTGQQIIDTLPTGCPWAQRYGLQALGQLQDRCWSRLLARPYADTAGGLADRARYETCIRCQLRSHRHVRYLRRLMGLEVAA